MPQAKTSVMNGKTAGQFNTTALVVNYSKYVLFFRSGSCMPLLEVDDQMLCTAHDNIVRQMTQAVSLKACTRM